MATMLVGALTSVSDARLPRCQRVKWARVAACTFSELPPTENITATVLVTATKCLDIPVIVRVLLGAVWGTYGGDARVAGWAMKLSDSARARGQLPTFVTLMELLVQMEHFTGDLSTETVNTLVEAAADQRCHVGLFDVAWYYEQRFGPSGVSPAWVRQVLDDPCVLEGARSISRSTCRVCPCCRVTPIWASGLMARARRRSQ
jgi:hypothetical protein